MEQLPAERLIKAYAKSMRVYYVAEKAFMAEPTRETLADCQVALERLVFLRTELNKGASLGDALFATEQQAEQA